MPILTVFFPTANVSGEVRPEAQSTCVKPVDETAGTEANKVVESGWGVAAARGDGCLRRLGGCGCIERLWLKQQTLCCHFMYCSFKSHFELSLTVFRRCGTSQLALRLGFQPVGGGHFPCEKGGRQHNAITSQMEEWFAFDM